jgi:hypothetical protein
LRPVSMLGILRKTVSGMIFISTLCGKSMRKDSARTLASPLSFSCHKVTL